MDTDTTGISTGTGTGTSTGITDGQAERIAYLRGLRPGWYSPGVGDLVDSRCLSAARDLLSLLPACEQDAWFLAPDLDGGIAAERADFESAPQAMAFCDISPTGKVRLIWFDGANIEHDRVYDDPATAAPALLAAVASIQPATAA